MIVVSLGLEMLWRSDALESSLGHDDESVAQLLAFLHGVRGQDDRSAQRHLASQQPPNSALGQNVHAAESKGSKFEAKITLALHFCNQGLPKKTAHHVKYLGGKRRYLE